MLRISSVCAEEGDKNCEKKKVFTISMAVLVRKQFPVALQPNFGPWPPP
jgi:hypothetical protein